MMPIFNFYKYNTKIIDPYSIKFYSTQQNIKSHITHLSNKNLKEDF